MRSGEKALEGSSRRRSSLSSDALSCLFICRRRQASNPTPARPSVTGSVAAGRAVAAAGSPRAPAALATSASAAPATEVRPASARPLSGPQAAWAAAKQQARAVLGEPPQKPPASAAPGAGRSTPPLQSQASKMSLGDFLRGPTGKPRAQAQWSGWSSEAPGQQAGAPSSSSSAAPAMASPAVPMGVHSGSPAPSLRSILEEEARRAAQAAQAKAVVWGAAVVLGSSPGGSGSSRWFLPEPPSPLTGLRTIQDEEARRKEEEAEARRREEEAAEQMKRQAQERRRRAKERKAAESRGAAAPQHQSPGAPEPAGDEGVPAQPGAGRGRGRRGRGPGGPSPEPDAPGPRPVQEGGPQTAPKKHRTRNGGRGRGHPASEHPSSSAASQPLVNPGASEGPS